jgi:hyperosmotically inducible periplasmic protein
MNNSKTPKIVVGVGLAAIYAAGFAYFALHGAQDNVIAPSASTASSAQVATPAVPPTDIVPSADLPTNVVEQPVAAAAPESLASAATVASAKPRVEFDARSRNKEQALGTLATAQPAETAEPQKSNSSSEGSSEVVQASAPPSAPSGNDSQITADVKSKIAEVAPAVAIDVTTKDGVVELTGSVPSEEVIDKARLAARNVADVRDVDVSALTISN